MVVRAKHNDIFINDGNNIILLLIKNITDYSSTASGHLDVCNANSTVACDKIPSQGKAFGDIAAGKTGG